MCRDNGFFVAGKFVALELETGSLLPFADNRTRKPGNLNAIVVFIAI